MKLQEITRFLEAKFPLQLQESYDNAGLIYGRNEQKKLSMKHLPTIAI
jgi:putative NIF3 family GTP cyclohydrolase 1 type 2